MNKRILRILLFYVIAICGSIVFRFSLFGLSDVLKTLPQWITTLIPISSFSVMLGGLLALALMRGERRLQFSLWGTSKGWSLLLAIIPIVLLGLAGIHNSIDTNVHLRGLRFGLSAFMYCLFEEIGWRGYLQDELKEIQEWKRVLIIGFLWWFWHLDFIRNFDPMGSITFFLGLTAGAWGLGKVIDHTKSVLASTYFHMAIFIMFTNPYLRKSLDSGYRLSILGICIIAGIFIMKKWNTEHKSEPEM